MKNKPFIVLCFSGALNILLAALLFYFQFKERPPTPYCEWRPPQQKKEYIPLVREAGNSELMRAFKELPLRPLIEKLKDRRQVEDGFAVRDLALGALVSFHGFDLKKAVAPLPEPKQKRALAIDGKKEALLFPGVTKKQFHQILKYAQTEKWPLTAEGLFAHLQKESNPSLRYAFCLTPEFLAVETLFKKTDCKREELAEMTAEGDWEMLHTFAEEQKASQDRSDGRRRQLLLDYIRRGSNTAAELLIRTDFTFAAKKMDDESVATLLRNLTERTPDSARFSLAMVMSPRSDAVWKEAAARLYEYTGEPKPEKIERNSVLARFVPVALSPKVGAAKPKKMPLPKPEPSSRRLYTVQKGDTLWKISRRFSVSVPKIKQQNSLTGDTLKPGSTLELPL